MMRLGKPPFEKWQERKEMINSRHKAFPKALSELGGEYGTKLIGITVRPKGTYTVF